MQLLNKTCLNGVPKLYEQDGLGDEAIVHLKFYIDSWTWLLTELDQKTGREKSSFVTRRGFFSLMFFASFGFGGAAANCKPATTAITIKT